MSEVSGLGLSAFVTSDQRMLWFAFVWFACVDVLHPNQQYFVMLGQFPVFLGCTITKQQVKCYAQGHNTVTLVSLELATIRTPILCSTN